MDKSSGAPKVTVTKEVTKEVTKGPVKKMTKDVTKPKKEADSTWIRPMPVSISAPWTNAKQPSCDKSAIADTCDPCNHTWVVRSHPSIPYSGAFCSKCDMEKV